MGGSRLYGCDAALLDLGLEKAAAGVPRGATGVLRNAANRVRRALVPVRQWVSPRAGSTNAPPAAPGAVYNDDYLEAIRLGTGSPSARSFAREQARARGMSLNEYLNRSQELRDLDKGTSWEPDPRFENLRFKNYGK